jgi:hypothetical protein
MDGKQIRVGEAAKGSEALALSAMQGACRILFS